MPFQISHGSQIDANSFAALSPWWQRGEGALYAERPLVDAFLADVELPFETAFWEQPALLMDDALGAAAPEEARGCYVVLAKAPLSELIAGFADASSADRSHYVLQLADGQRLDAAEIEGLVEDAAFR